MKTSTSPRSRARGMFWALCNIFEPLIARNYVNIDRCITKRVICTNLICGRVSIYTPDRHHWSILTSRSILGWHSIDTSSIFQSVLKWHLDQIHVLSGHLINSWWIVNQGSANWYTLIKNYTRFQCYVHRRHLRSSFDMPSFDRLCNLAYIKMLTQRTCLRSNSTFGHKRWIYLTSN